MQCSRCSAKIGQPLGLRCRGCDQSQRLLHALPRTLRVNCSLSHPSASLFSAQNRDFQRQAEVMVSQMHGAAVAAAVQLEAVRGNLTQQVC